MLVYRKTKGAGIYSAYSKEEFIVAELVRFLKKEISQLEEDLLHVKNEASYSVLLNELKIKKGMLNKITS